MSDIDTLKRLVARTKAKKLEVDIEPISVQSQIMAYGEALGVKYPAMLIHYPEDFNRILRNDYSKWDIVLDI